jgi:DNA recombination protein RmuC
METVIYIAIACVVGALLGYVFTKTRNHNIVPVLRRENNVLQQSITRLSEELKSVGLQNSRLLTENGRLTGQLEQTSERLEERNIELTATSAKLISAREELISSARQLQFQQENLERLKAEFQSMSATMHADFRNMADTILEEKSRKFTDLNEEKMRGVLEPLKSNLAEFKSKVEETYDKESKQRFSLEKELNRLVELNQQLGQEASNLTNALKQNNKVLGNWGEMILESLLENSGLTRGREYFVQEFLRDESGNRVRDNNGSMLQPDITVLYPDGRRLIIDSKMSLLAYESYNSCADQTAGGGFLKDHCQSLRSHIENLSRKEYPKYAGAALDLVILFVPLEPAYFLALREDPTLWKYAFDRKVLLTTSTHLLAILKIVGEFWKVDLQNRNALEIAEKAGALYDKFAGFVEVMDQLGGSLEKAALNFQLARKRLSEGTGNLIKRSEELKRMGAKTNRSILWKDDGSEES